jgi:hypothetical protein
LSIRRFPINDYPFPISTLPISDCPFVDFPSPIAHFPSAITDSRLPIYIGQLPMGLPLPIADFPLSITELQTKKGAPREERALREDENAIG